jgi:hypothetical protein
VGQKFVEGEAAKLQAVSRAANNSAAYIVASLKTRNGLVVIPDGYVSTISRFQHRSCSDMAALAMFLHTHQNPLDGTAARCILVLLELIGLSVEETCFHDHSTKCRSERKAA